MLKKLIFIFSILYSSLTAQNAPNLVLTDLNGVTHNIYNYLDEGKSVVLDFFIKNCVPCQESVPYMHEFYQAYGPDGTDLIEVISIEVNENSTGEIIALVEDWGITNPVINLDEVPPAYDPIVNGYPYYVIICPDRSFSSINDFSYPSTLLFWEQSLNLCNDIHFDATIINTQVLHCQDYVSAYLEVANTGTEIISELEIDVYVDSVFTNTIELDMFLPPLLTTNQTQQNINFESVGIEGELIEFEISSDDDINTLNNYSFHDLTDEIIAPSSNITFEILMDNYASDLHWTLRDDNGNTIMEGAGSDYSPYELVSIDLELDTSVCYTFHIVDVVGDGICCSYGEGYYQILSDDEVLYFNNSFTTSLTHSFHIAPQVGIEELSCEPKIVTSDFFNLNGQQINAPTQLGVYIRKDYLENGFTKSSKIVIDSKP